MSKQHQVVHGSTRTRVQKPVPAIPTLSRSYIVMSFRLTSVRSSASTVLPPNPAACPRVGVWDKPWDKYANYFETASPQFRFCPRDKNDQVFGVRDYSKRTTKRVIVFIEAYLAKRIVAGGFIGSCSCKSRGMRKRDKLKSRYWRLYLRPQEQRSLAICQRYALGRFVCLLSVLSSPGARVESIRQAHRSK